MSQNLSGASMGFEGVKNKYGSNYKTIVWLITGVASLLSLAIVMFFGSDEYGMLFLLPGSFLIVNTFCVHLYSSEIKSVALRLIQCGYLIRMVIAPSLFCLGGCVSFFKVTIQESAINNACIYSAFECVIVLFACALFFSNKADFREKKAIAKESMEGSSLGIVLLVLCIFLIIAYITIPAISTIYQFPFSTSLSNATNIRWDNNTIVARGSVTRYIYSLFTFIWPGVRMLLPTFLISAAFMRFGNTSKAVWLSIASFAVPFVLLSADNIAPFLSIGISLLVIMRLYGEKAQPLVRAGVVVLLMAAAVVVAAKLVNLQNWRGASGIALLAQMTELYFPGFQSSAIALQIEDKNPLSTLMFDLYYCIPFKESLFGLHGSNLTDLFCEVAGANGLILPFSSQLMHYLTPLFAPFAVCLFAIAALKAESYANETDSFWRVFLFTYLFVILSISINLYSVSICLRSLVNVGLFSLIVVYFSTRYRNSGSSNEVRRHASNRHNESAMRYKNARNQ